MSELIYGWIGMRWWMGRLDWESRTLTFECGQRFNLSAAPPLPEKGRKRQFQALQVSCDKLQLAQIFGVEPVKLRK